MQPLLQCTFLHNQLRGCTCIQILIWEPSNVAWQPPIQTITTVLATSIQLPHTLEKGTKDHSLHSLPAVRFQNLPHKFPLVYIHLLDWLVWVRAVSRNTQWSAIVLSVRYFPNCCYSLNGRFSSNIWRSQMITWIHPLSWLSFSSNIVWWIGELGHFNKGQGQ
jgi:hypothetical protein